MIQSEPSEGNVCRKCWLKVFLFHEFYTHIESIHGTQLTIFVDNLPDPASSVKLRLDSANPLSDGCEVKGENIEVESKAEDFNNDGFNDGAINDLPVNVDDCDIFGDIVAKPKLKRASAATPAPKQTRKRMPGGYKRKYDRRIRHDYSSFQ